MNSLTVRRALIAYTDRLARNIAPERAREDIARTYSLNDRDRAEFFGQVAEESHDWRVTA